VGFELFYLISADFYFVWCFLCGDFTPSSNDKIVETGAEFLAGISSFVEKWQDWGYFMDTLRSFLRWFLLRRNDKIGGLLCGYFVEFSCEDFSPSMEMTRFQDATWLPKVSYGDFSFKWQDCRKKIGASCGDFSFDGMKQDSGKKPQRKQTWNKKTETWNHKQKIKASKHKFHRRALRFINFLFPEIIWSEAHSNLGEIY